MPTDDFLHAYLNQMIDPYHLLAVLANRPPWSDIETDLHQLSSARIVKAKWQSSAIFSKRTLASVGKG